MLPWVERETRAFIGKAAERAGKTLGQYLNDKVRGFAQNQLVHQVEATSQAERAPATCAGEIAYADGRGHGGLAEAAPIR